ncbi:sugar phosphate isomerase/epimerase family protein [Dyadobacter sediminis]|uniref:Sugar phosphate isomerase/epimerase n=1 Tax=Dyadobacter sediminis TaxID=1493691 RepID=A0A5R9KDK9_9BACT|nr:sugar phosphate isomerase/epimerase family protein [Dyadobacter sediminis]TLU94146.1 sugar phosphate isomerase/epimerase [Dyadobacter sediminis]GGB93805.1 isomerase [Dyadobacter sediminis]
MNKIGFNVLAWTAAVSDDLFPVIDRLKSIGYDGAEFYLGPQDAAVYRRMGDYTRNVGLETTAVVTLGVDENPVSESVEVRRKALDKIKWAVDRAHDLNARIICGPFHSAHTVFVNRPALDQEYALAGEVLNAAADYAAQANIVFALEALNRFECYLCNTMEQLYKLVKAADHPNVKAMFDTHHSNIEEKKYSTALQTIAPVLAHVHISENDRGTPGDGQVLWDDAFSSLAAINYKGWLTIEAFSRNDPDFANAIGVWREFSEPWDIAENGYRFIREMSLKHGL